MPQFYGEFRHGPYQYWCTDCGFRWSQPNENPDQLCVVCESFFVEYLGVRAPYISPTTQEPTTEQTKGNKNVPEIKFSPEDLLERTQLAPGWRTLICKSIDEGPGKNDPSSIVYTCVFVVDGGKENGVPIRHWFSEKAMGRIVDYIKCFIQDVKADTIYDLNKTVGLKVDGYCQYDLGQGYNTIKDWRPTGKSAAATGGKGK